jgi:nucleoside-diphosphate kinase
MAKENIQDIKKQQTFVMIKPDWVARWLIGEIISRLEKKQLKIVAMKMLQATQDQIQKHYPADDDVWVTRLGTKSLGTFSENGLDAKDFLWTDQPHEIGKKVLEYLINYMTRWPILIMVVQWVNAIDMVRKIVGDTIPAKAALGTIRWDYSIETPFLANIETRPMYNIIHASETLEESEKEIALWFDASEITVQ